MRGRLLVTLLVGGGVIVVLLVILVALPGRSKQPAKTYLQPDAAATGADSRADPVTSLPTRCTVMNIALSPEERAGGATFVAIVDAEPGSGEVTAAGSVFLFMELQHHVDYGPWAPAVTYLEQSARFFVDHEGSVPTRSAEVVAAARRVDRDLAAGTCR